MRYYILPKSLQIESPETESSKVETKPEKRNQTYLSGESIPESLPDSYGLAQNCYNCSAYDLTTEICSAYKATVRPNYWCAAWKGK